MLKKFLITAIALFMLPVGATQLAAQENVLPKLPKVVEYRLGYWDPIVYGNKDAKVVVREYASLICPHCGHFARDVYPLLKTKYIDTGKIRFEIDNIIGDEFDLTLATAARCKDNEYAANFTKDVLAQQAQWMAKGADAAAIILAIAEKYGINEQAFGDCLNNRPLQNHLIANTQRVVKNGTFEGTPAVYINGEYIGEPTWAKLDAAISAALLTAK